jgi:hypothetical protein
MEGATGAAYPGVTYREVHDTDGPTRLAFRAYWRQANYNPSLLPFLDILRERYPDFSGTAGRENPNQRFRRVRPYLQSEGFKDASHSVERYPDV